MIGAALVVALGTGRAGAETLQTTRAERPAAATIVSHALVGGIAGATVSGVVIGYEMGLTNHADFPWAPVLAAGAGLGLLAGLAWGIAEVGTGPPSYEAANGPVRDRLALRDQRPLDRSGMLTMTVAAGRF